MVAESGNTVRLHYTGQLPDGSVFDSTQGREPVTIELGSGKLLPAFEQAVLGMEPGESKTVEIACQEAYGPRREDRVLAVNRSQLPVGVDPNLGQRLNVSLGEDRKAFALVTGVSEKTVTLDLNHPFAGHDLKFRIQLVSIE